MRYQPWIHRALMVVFLACGAWGAAAPAEAQSEFGIRAGISGDPDQFFVGGHFETAPLVDRLRFRPNVEVGFGDGITLIAINVEFAYHFRLSTREWDVYAGGGPAANAYQFEARHHRDGGIEAGFNFLIGVGHRDGLFTELKLGAADSPSVKLAVGYAWW